MSDREWCVGHGANSWHRNLCASNGLHATNAFILNFLARVLIIADSVRAADHLNI